MKKTLIASAVAAAALTSNAFAMDNATDIAEKLNSMPQFYGNVQVAFNYVDTDAASSNSVDDNGSTFGLKHSHMISEGVTAFAKLEFEFDADEDVAGIDQADEAYVGVKGDFGSVQYGVDDTVYEWVDVVDTSENIGISGDLAGVSEVENIQYVSPEIAPGLVVGVTLAAETETNGVDVAHAGALAAKYSMDNLEVAFAYAMARGTTEDTVGLGVTYSMDDLTILAQYETESDVADYMGLQGMYTMGQNQFALGYGVQANDGGEDEATVYLQALHNVSDNVYVYLEYTMETDAANTADNDIDTLALGAAYNF
jgi:predicted porin